MDQVRDFLEIVHTDSFLKARSGGALPDDDQRPY